jgi:hypothetical protein
LCLSAFFLPLQAWPRGHPLGPIAIILLVFMISGAWLLIVGASARDRTKQALWVMTRA